MQKALSSLLLLMWTVSADLSFLAIGDWGGMPIYPYHTPAQKKAAAGMALVANKSRASFVLALGDNFYTAGIPTDDHDKRFQTTWEEVYLEHDPLQVPWYVCAGNHDHKGNVTAQIEFSNENQFWTYPDYHHNYVASWKDGSGKDMSLEVILIDTIQLAGALDYDEDHPNYFDPLPGPESKQRAKESYEWIEAQMKASTADYLLVAGHYPVYSVCSHGPTSFLIDNLVPLLEKYNAHYLSGHDHCASHVEDKGVSYILSGVGDTCCYKAKHLQDVPTDSLKYYLALGHNPSRAKTGFVGFVANSTGLVSTYYDQDGAELFKASTISPRSVSTTQR